MKTLYSIFYILFFGIRIRASERKYIPEDWIDPTDMRNYDHYTKTMKNPSSLFKYENDIDPDWKIHSKCVNDEIEKYQVFLKRFINLLLNSARLNDEILDVDKNETIERTIRIFISTDELRKLRTLSSDIKPSDLRELDEILSIVMNKGFGFGFSDFEPSFNSFINLFNNITLQIASFIFFGITFTVTIWIYLIDRSLLRATAFLLLIFYMGGLVWTWFSLYEDKVAEQFAYLKTVSNLSSVCDPGKSSFWSLKYYFGSIRDECKEYYQQVHIDPFIKVPPSLVISEATSMMIIQPLKALGLGLGGLVGGICSELPWPLRVVLFPIVLIIILILIFPYLGYKLSAWSLIGGITLDGRSTRFSSNCPLISSEEDLRNAVNQQESGQILIDRRLLKKCFMRFSPSEPWDRNLEYGQGDTVLKLKEKVFSNSSIPEFSVNNALNTSCNNDIQEVKFSFNRSRSENSNEIRQSSASINAFANLCHVISRSKINSGKKLPILKSKYR